MAALLPHYCVAVQEYLLAKRIRNSNPLQYVEINSEEQIKVKNKLTHAKLDDVFVLELEFHAYISTGTENKQKISAL